MKKQIKKSVNSGLNLSLVRLKSNKVSKVFSIGPYLCRINKSPLSIPFKKIIKLSFDRASGLANRVRILQQVLMAILQMKKNHGSDFTVK